MYLFIDTNIFLSFFGYTGDDDLQTLLKIRHHIKRKHVQFILTDQVIHEFNRRRSDRIRQTIEEFIKTPVNRSVPQIGEGLDAYDPLGKTLQRAYNEKTKLINDIRQKAQSTIPSLPPDPIIKTIFDHPGRIDASAADIEKANERMNRGNPPGKGNSKGDAINWEIILRTTPAQSDDLHIVSADGDFADALDKNRLHSFLRHEYEELDGQRENSAFATDIYLHKSLHQFLISVRDRLEREEADDSFYANLRAERIDDLLSSPHFGQTRRAVQALSPLGEFTLDEVKTMLDALIENDQIRLIGTEYEVRQFYAKVTGVHWEHLARYHDAIHEILGDDDPGKENSDN